MSIPSLPATLTPPLTGREAITDAIYRCVLAFDTNDLALLKSSFTNDAVFDLNGKIMDGFDAIVTECYDSISKMDTTHFLSNMRVNVLDGGEKSEMTCSALAQHYRGGEGMKAGAVPVLVGGLYWIRLVRDGEDELWKIEHFKLRSTWGQGDWGVFGA
ncbi:hypothetical protein BJX76DRAFT_369398 [Aspergillus varians]